MNKNNSNKLLIELASILESNKQEIAYINTQDTYTSLTTNIENIERAISTLKAFANKQQKAKSTGGVAIYSCYGDPSFGLFGMALAPALLAEANEFPILIGFPKILSNYGRFIAKIIQKSKLFSDIQFVFDVNEFFSSTLSQNNIKHSLVFGDKWIRKHINEFKNKKSLTYYGPGNNAAVILNGANLSEAIEKVLDSAFILNGQAAVCINRCIIDDKIDKQEVKRIFINKLNNISYGFNKDSFVTPIKISQLVQRIKSRVNKACENGAEAINFNIEKEGNSHLIHPSIVFMNDIKNDLWKDYHFAPVLPISFLKYEQIANEVNNTDFGIYASLWGDKSELKGIKNIVENEHFLVLENQSILDVISIQDGFIEPWGGYKNSGFSIGSHTNWEVQEGFFDFYNIVTH